MKSIFKVLEPYGFEQVIVDDDFQVIEPYTEVFPLQPCLKPAFDYEKNCWYETATDEEVAVMLDNLEKSIEIVEEQEEQKEVSVW